MDLMGYAILERVAIVAGAVLMGFWGYRLYLAEKTVGLVFMGLSVLLLGGALMTGTSYVRTLGAGMQVASTPTPAAEPAEEPVGPAASPVAVVAEVPDEAAPDPLESPFRDRVAVVTPVLEPAPAASAAAAGTAVDTDAAETAEAPEPSPPLATAEELGGRILSVRSDRVSLEWSSDSD